MTKKAIKNHLDNDDIIEVDEEGVEQSCAEKIKDLRNKLKVCENERTEYLAGWQRAKADYINLKKSEEENRKSIVKFAKEDLLHELIDLADNFEMAFANKEAWEEAPANWRLGVEYIYNKLSSILTAHGLEAIDPLGQVFNPAEHHALGQKEVEDKELADKIVFVSKKGYRLNGKLIRPAEVKIAKLVN